MEVKYFFRHKNQGHSIESLFSTIVKNLPTSVRPIRLHAPYGSANFKAIIGNLFWAYRTKGDFFHITGDIHYIALALPRKKVILTIHDLRLVEQFFGLKGILYKILWFSLPSKKVRYITVISEETKKVLLKHIKVPSDKVKVIPNCVSPLFEFEDRSFNSECPVILQIGTKENKNLERLAAALKGMPCRLKIIGRPTPFQQEILQKNSIDFDWVSDLSMEEIVQVYKDCDLVCFVSTYEGFGMPIIEAQATGRPVVTSNISSMPEVARDTACLVDPFDMSSIRNGILRVMEDPFYREKLISRGLENVKRFQAKTVAAQYEALYSQINRE